MKRRSQGSWFDRRWRGKSRKRILFVVIMGMAASSSGHAAADEAAWDNAFDPNKGERFIPLELWTGGDWDGAREIGFHSADLTFGRRGRKRITGPEHWVRPGTGEKLQIYRRVNKSKVQLFTVRKDKVGLGRVFDSRYNRDCVDAIKFPLGLWKQGEVRSFRFACGNRRRSVVMVMEKIDFTYKGLKHALRYRWTVDGGAKKGMDNSYIYAPGKGNVKLDYHTR